MQQSSLFAFFAKLILQLFDLAFSAQNATGFGTGTTTGNGASNIEDITLQSHHSQCITKTAGHFRRTVEVLGYHYIAELSGYDLIISLIVMDQFMTETNDAINILFELLKRKLTKEGSL